MRKPSPASCRNTLAAHAAVFLSSFVYQLAGGASPAPPATQSWRPVCHVKSLMLEEAVWGGPSHVARTPART